MVGDTCITVASQGPACSDPMLARLDCVLRVHRKIFIHFAREVASRAFVDWLRDPRATPSELAPDTRRKPIADPANAVTAARALRPN
jgi:hypothetical protein